MLKNGATYSDSDIKRFLSKFVIGDGCWIWVAAKQNGYGTMRVSGDNERAHRISYTLFNGDIPDRVLVCHKCDNPSCVNPSHLFLGTVRDNNLDKIAKGRNPKTTRKKVIPPDIEEEIKKTYLSGDFTADMLSRIYGYPKCIIRVIVRGLIGHRSRFDDEVISKVIAMCKSEYRYVDIAKECGVSERYVGLIAHGYLPKSFGKRRPIGLWMGMPRPHESG